MADRSTSNTDSNGSTKRKTAEDDWKGFGHYMSAKQEKLWAQFERGKAFETKKSEIFSGVCIFVNGYTDPPADELCRLMQQHGGEFHLYETSRTTHVIASNLCHTKLVQVKPTDMIVRPQWVTESIKAGRLLPEDEYLLVKRKNHGTMLKFLGANRDQGQAEEIGPIGEAKDGTSKNEQADESDRPTLVCEDDGSMSMADGGRSSSGVQVEEQQQRGSPPQDDQRQDESPSPSIDRQQKVKPCPSNDQRQSPVSPSTSAESRRASSPTEHQSNVRDEPSTKEPPTNQVDVDQAPRPTSSKATARAGDPSFLKDYYARSRLHFISTWAQEMKSFVNELKADASPTFDGVEKLKSYLHENHRSRDSAASSSPPLDDCGTSSDNNGVFMHLDMDCFFVSVGLRKRPDLRGQPVAVAHSSGTKGKSTSTTIGATTIIDESGNEKFSSCSDIASCSYEARACGVRNGMWLGKAKELCPNLRVISYDFEEYHQVSKKLYTIVASYTLQIEPVSCDEVYLDVTSLCRETGASPLDVATVIRRDIFEQCQCPSSTGIGPNMLVARLATKKAKPNGQYYVTADRVTCFMADQKVADIPGVGYEGQRKFESLDVETCEQLWAVPLATLRQLFGPKTASQLYNFSKGIDVRKVKDEIVRKSVSCDMNYGIRFTEKQEVHKFLIDFAGEVTNRLKKHKVKGRMIVLKLQIRSPEAPIDPPKFLGTGRCDAVSRSTTLSIPTDDSSVIAKECIGLFDQISPLISDLRGIGISMQKLESTTARGDDRAGSILQFMKAAKESRKASSPRMEQIVEENSRDRSVSPKKPRVELKKNASPSDAKPSCASTIPKLTKPPSDSSRPTLFGETEPELIRTLLADWIKCGDAPLATDIAGVTRYFIDLIEDLDMATVKSLLRMIRDCANQRGAEEWLRAAAVITTDVQEAIRRRYGCPLKF